MSTKLAEKQALFLRAILDENSPLPKGWGNSQAAGMSVYRGNYRSALMEALASTFERTGRYVGEKAFAQASINHAIKHPPSGWTIDDVGKSFDETCRKFFKDNPEVCEIAWLEWSMLQLATAPDCEVMTPQAFADATSSFDDEAWGHLRLTFQPRATARVVSTNLTGIWKALGSDAGDLPEAQLSEPQTCLVWREGERPTFVLVEADHAAAFAAMQGGATYGQMIELLLGDASESDADAVQAAAMRSGAMLGKWLQEGLLIGLQA